MSDELRLANGLTVADVAVVKMRQQEAVDAGRLVLVDGVGYVPRSMLDDQRDPADGFKTSCQWCDQTSHPRWMGPFCLRLRTALAIPTEDEG